MHTGKFPFVKEVSSMRSFTWVNESEYEAKNLPALSELHLLDQTETQGCHLLQDKNIAFALVRL
jgi:hypothetical protein